MHPTVRSRACYLFLRFVKVQLSNLGPFTSSIIQSVKEYLPVTPEVRKLISLEDHLYLYEAIGSLIGSLKEGGNKFTEEVVSPLIAQVLGDMVDFSEKFQMEVIVSKELYRNDTPEQPVYTSALIQLIYVIGTFSKGKTRFTPM
jgi:hypothetical protein